MDERAELGTQAERLRKRFKQTVVPQEWVPSPTAGDKAREVGADLETVHADERERADQTSRSLWDGTMKERQ